MTGIHQLLLTTFSGAVDPIEASGGNETKTLGDFKYHVFTAAGDFAVTVGGLANVIAIGAGGSGGVNGGGGGGAGEVDNLTEVTFEAGTTYKVIIGASNASNSVSQGGSTIISAGGTNLVTCLGGGDGGNQSTDPDTRAGRAGGSGGGGAGTGNANAGGAANGDNTNVGGAANSGGQSYNAGGGGGATQVGSVGPDKDNFHRGGAGGEGMALTAMDTALAFATFTEFDEANSGIVASGGGGGANPQSAQNAQGQALQGSDRAQGGTGAGLGGVGNGSYANAGVTATNAGSFGSGGGGSGAPTETAGVGKQGLLIIRYAASWKNLV